jgi:glutamine cyclotransferase
MPPWPSARWIRRQPAHSGPRPWVWRAAVAALLAGCGRPRGPEPFRTVARYPHDSAAYTQGLVALGDTVYESTGLYGHSELRRVDLRSGRVLAAVRLPPDRFGEGLALLKGRFYQLTWTSGVAYVYDSATLSLSDSVRYAGQGWGLATDGASLIMSDGSDSLRVVDPATFRVERVVHVQYNGAPLYQLNALAWVHGDLFANVYQSNWVLRIDPRTGKVRQVLDCTDLYPERRRPPYAEVMNGIATAANGDLLLTGKNWPVMFRVKLSGRG